MGSKKISIDFATSISRIRFSAIRNPKIFTSLDRELVLTLLTPEVLRAISSALDFSSAFSTSPVIVTSPFFTSTFVPKIPLAAY